MKTATLVLLVHSALSVAAIRFVSGPEGWVPAMGFNATKQPWDDIKTHPLAKRAEAPKRQDMKSRVSSVPGSKTVKLRYGPYTVPAPMIAGGEGMIWNQPNPWIDKPCESGKCIILGMNAGLEYPDGNDANTDTMMWLHHMVLFNIGTGVWDATCSVFSLPHMIVMSTPMTSERIFSSGNERTMAFFNPPGNSGAKMGYPVFASDRFGLIADLMNMNPTSKSVYLTMYYDYVEGSPAGFDEVKPVWFDVNQCSTSEVGGGSAGSSFKISSTPWSANFEGEVMGISGHIHDGGSHVDMVVNNQVICTSKATYGTNEQAKARADIIKDGGIPNSTLDLSSSPGAMGGHGHAGGKHIVTMSICGDMAGYNGNSVTPLKLKNMVKGQSWKLDAYYDYKKHDGMKNNFGTMDNIMGIAHMFVKVSPKIRST